MDATRLICNYLIIKSASVFQILMTDELVLLRHFWGTSCKLQKNGKSFSTFMETASNHEENSSEVRSTLEVGHFAAKCKFCSASQDCNVPKPATGILKGKPITPAKYNITYLVSLFSPVFSGLFSLILGRILDDVNSMLIEKSVNSGNQLVSPKIRICNERWALDSFRNSRRHHSTPHFGKRGFHGHRLSNLLYVILFPDGENSEDFVNE